MTIKMAESKSLKDLFSTGAAWAIGEHKKPVVISEMFALADLCFSGTEPTPKSLRAVEFFSSSAVVEDTVLERDLDVGTDRHVRPEVPRV